MTYFNGRNYDPIDFEDFSANSIWVLEDEPPTLTADELESFRRKLTSFTIQESQNIGKYCWILYILHLSKGFY